MRVSALENIYEYGFVVEQYIVLILVQYNIRALIIGLGCKKGLIR